MRTRAATAVVVWSAVFVAPHLYWAVGGRGGLGTEGAAADAAFDRPWFAAYNLLAVALATVGAALCVLWARERVRGPWVRRWRAVTLLAAVVLLARGVLGLVLLALSSGLGEEPLPPPVLLAVEPWFVIGGLLYVGVHRLVPAVSRPTGPAG